MGSASPELIRAYRLARLPIRVCSPLHPQTFSCIFHPQVPSKQASKQVRSVLPSFGHLAFALMLNILHPQVLSFGQDVFAPILLYFNFLLQHLVDEKIEEYDFGGLVLGCIEADLCK